MKLGIPGTSILPLAWGVLFVLAILPGIPSLGGEFVWDDRRVIPTNAYWTAEPSPWKGIWTRDYGLEVTRTNTGHYRPITSLTVLATVQMFGTKHAFPYRLTNLLLHGVNAIFAFAVFGRILASTTCSISYQKLAGFLGALIFAVAGWNSETIGFITGRGDSLGLAFLFFAAIMLIPSSGEKPGFVRVAAGALLLLLAVLAKESMIMAVVWIPPAVFLLRNPQEPLWAKLRTAAYLSIMVILSCGLIRSASGVFAPSSLTVPSSALGAGRAGLIYLFQLLCPADILVVDPSKPILPILRQPYWLQVGLIGPILLLLLVSGIRAQPKIAGAVLLWIGFFMAPVLLMHTTKGYLIGERFLYLPGVAIAMLGGLGAAGLISSNNRQMSRGVQLTLAIWVLVNMTWQFDKVLVWSNQITFWGRVEKINPLLTAAGAHRGVALWRAGRLDEAATVLQKYLDRKHDPEADLELIAALKKNPC